MVISITLASTCPYTSFTGSGLINDLNTRFTINDTYVSSYYFWWTSITYLASFLWLFLMVILLALTPKEFEFKNIAIVTSSLIFTVEISDFLVLNNGWTQSNYTGNGLNVLLTSQLNCYHPLILYSSFFVLISSLLVYSNTGTDNIYYLYPRYTRLSRTLNWLFTSLNVTALYLGSWWAIQEGTWGGWWNWDTSEVLGWLITLYFVVCLHSVIASRWRTIQWYKHSILLKSVIFMYTLVQISFELTAHNFGIKFFYFFNNSLFLIEIFLLTGVWIFYSTKLVINYRQFSNIQSWGNSINVFSEYSFKAFIRILFTLFIFMFIILSSKPLAIHLTWIFFELQNSTVLVTNSGLTFLLMFCFHATLLRSRYFSVLLVFFYTITASCWLWIVTAYIKAMRRVYVIHISLLIFIIINWSTISYNFSYWFIVPFQSLIVHTPFLFASNQNLTLLDAKHLECVLVEYAILEKRTENWVFLSDSNSNSLNSFTLGTSHYSSWNWYYLGEIYLFVLMNEEIPFTTYLSLIFFGLVIYFISTYWKVQLII